MRWSCRSPCAQPCRLVLPGAGPGVWSVWEAFHGGDTTLPAFLLGVQAIDFLPGAVDRPGQSGDDRVKREFVLWVILTVALVAFSLLLVLGG